MSVLKAFNSHLIEFADDIIQLFPDDTNIKATKVFLSGLQKVNPKSIIVAWKDWIIAPYRPQIRKGDFEFFINKDYTNDVGQGSADNGSEVLKSIEVIRARIRTMNKDNQEKSMKYVQNLTKLCDMYFNNSK